MLLIEQKNALTKIVRINDAVSQLVRKSLKAIYNILNQNSTLQRDSKPQVVLEVTAVLTWPLITLVRQAPLCVLLQIKPEAELSTPKQFNHVNSAYAKE